MYPLQASDSSQIWFLALEAGSDIEATDLGDLTRPQPSGTYTLVQGCEWTAGSEETRCWWNGVSFLEALHALVDGAPGLVRTDLDFDTAEFVEKRARFHNASHNILEEFRLLQLRGYDTIQDFEPGLHEATCNATHESQPGVRYQFKIDQTLRRRRPRGRGRCRRGVSPVPAGYFIRRLRPDENY